MWWQTKSNRPLQSTVKEYEQCNFKQGVAADAATHHVSLQIVRVQCYLRASADVPSRFLRRLRCRVSGFQSYRTGHMLCKAFALDVGQPRWTSCCFALLLCCLFGGSAASRNSGFNKVQCLGQVVTRMAGRVTRRGHPEGLTIVHTLSESARSGHLHCFRKYAHFLLAFGFCCVDEWPAQRTTS